MLLGHYRNRLRVTLGSSAAPYGYTLATWTSGAVLTNARGIPNAAAALTFMIGAVLGFVFVGALAFGALGLALFLVVFLAALVGERSVGTNLAPTFILVIFWVGLVPLTILFGNVWAWLSPWRAAAELVAWCWGRAGLEWEPPFAYPERLGRWPARGPADASTSRRTSPSRSPR